MVRRRSLRAALVGAAALVASAAFASAPAHADDSDLRAPGARAGAGSVERAAPVSRRAVRRAAEGATPLAVTIDTLTPSSIPARGKVRVAGTVTNTDSVPWLTVNVYSFISAEPMTTRAQLADAIEVEESTTVGERITDVGSYDTIDAIEPGESSQFTFTVDVDLLAADTPGVYWFGVHALGQRSDEGRDELAIADGRARTFLPMVPERRQGQEAVSVVVPLRGPLGYAPDGSLGDLERWTATLADGGRLRSLVEFAATSGDQTVSWVVDPALIDAVRQLASGNPARSLAPNLEEGEDDGEGDGTDQPSPTDAASGEPSPTPTPSATPGDESSPADDPDDPATAELPDDLDPETRAAAEVAREWLGRLRAAMDAGDEVLALPYGDLDVSASARHDRQAYPRARARSAGTLPAVGVETAPAIAAPGGYVSPDALRSLDQDTTILVTDKMFDKAPAVAAVSGRRLVVTSTGSTQGGPPPGDPLGTIAIRQRVLAEAAVRFLRPGRSPLVVLLPPDWVPPSSSSFFAGLDLEWIDLTSVAQATDDANVESMAAADLHYPDPQRAYELDAANFAAAKELRETGAALQSMLTLNNIVGDTVTDQALTSTSYSARVRPDSARVSADQSRLWIEARMEQVEVSAPQAVTLSSINGSFPISINNRLDEPVTVSVAAQVSDGALQIADPGEVDILAEGSATVLLDARTDTPGIHDVTIVVTDKTGRPVGGSDELSIRSARVSNVIWLFLATGIGLLFGTIAFRLVRRVRAART